MGKIVCLLGLVSALDGAHGTRPVGDTFKVSVKFAASAGPMQARATRAVRAAVEKPRPMPEIQFLNMCIQSP